MRVDAWAKINLTLHVTGRRDDGYHELDSLVVFAGVGDTLEIAPAADLSLTLTGPFAGALETDSGNLVLRAARALQARFKTGSGANLTLDKRLPVAAGIGGGSADAAAALCGLNEIWGLNASEAELRALGARLGADVPVCVAGRACFLAGTGERIEPAPPLPPVWLVLVNPLVPLSTPSVFKARSGAFSQARRPSGPLPDAQALALFLSQGCNDLEAPARGLLPVIGDLLAALRATPDCLLARMSGSGATCFGMYRDEAAARAAAAQIAAVETDWWVSPAPVLRS